MRDVVLVHADGSDLFSRAIEVTQTLSRSGYTRQGSICTHAAVYVGDGLIVDATHESGVSVRSVWSYCQYRRLQVRRIPLDDEVPGSISGVDIAAIATAAQKHVGESYSVAEAVLSALGWSVVPNPDALYCSTFVGLVVAEATGFDLSYARDFQPLYPGTLAAHPDLVDVSLEWRGL